MREGGHEGVLEGGTEVMGGWEVMKEGGRAGGREVTRARAGIVRSCGQAAPTTTVAARGLEEQGLGQRESEEARGDDLPMWSFLHFCVRAADKNVRKDWEDALVDGRFMVYRSMPLHPCGSHLCPLRAHPQKNLLLYDMEYMT